MFVECSNISTSSVSVFKGTRHERKHVILNCTLRQVRRVNVQFGKPFCARATEPTISLRQSRITPAATFTQSMLVHRKSRCCNIQNASWLQCHNASNTVPKNMYRFSVTWRKLTIIGCIWSLRFASTCCSDYIRFYWSDVLKETMRAWNLWFNWPRWHPDDES